MIVVRSFINMHMLQLVDVLDIDDELTTSRGEVKVKWFLMNRTLRISPRISKPSQSWKELIESAEHAAAEASPEIQATY